MNSLLIKAKKGIFSTETSESSEIKKAKEFNDLISDWQEVSQKVLIMLNKKDQVSSGNRTNKSLIAFGAMGAHINMALQALKSTELDK